MTGTLGLCRVDYLRQHDTFMLTHDFRTIYEVVSIDAQGDIDCEEFMTLNNDNEYVRCNPRKVLFRKEIHVIPVQLKPALFEVKHPVLGDLTINDLCIRLDCPGVIWRVAERPDISGDIKCIQEMALNKGGVWNFIHEDYDYFNVNDRITRVTINIEIEQPTIIDANPGQRRKGSTF